MLNNAQKNPKEHSYQNSVLVLCIIFDRLVFHYFFQLIFRLASAGSARKVMKNLSIKHYAQH